jgi:hypothetical protein
MPAHFSLNRARSTLASTYAE